MEESPGNPSHDSAVRAMFGRIASRYDPLNRILSLGIDRYWRLVLARSVRPGKQGIVLDLASGTLDVAVAIGRQHPDCLVPAMDFCPPMLMRGISKLSKDNVKHIFPVAADAKKLPLPDSTVGSVSMAFGIRNILPRCSALSEMLRVLAPGGRACILEFGSGRDFIFGGLYNLYLFHILPYIGAFFSSDPGAYTYLAETIRRFPSAEELAVEMREAGFVNVSWHKLTGGIVCLHIGEKRAE